MKAVTDCQMEQLQTIALTNRAWGVRSNKILLTTQAKTFLECQKRIWNELTSTKLANRLTFNLLSMLIILKK